MKDALLWLTAAGVLLGIIACADTSQSTPATIGVRPSGGAAVERIDDAERGVTCYVYRGYALSCVKVTP